MAIWSQKQWDVVRLNIKGQSTSSVQRQSKSKSCFILEKKLVWTDLIKAYEIMGFKRNHSRDDLFMFLIVEELNMSKLKAKESYF